MRVPLTMRHLAQAIWYEARRMVLHRDLRLLVFGAPILYGVLLSSVYVAGSLRDIHVGVIDRDGTRLSRLLVRMLDATSGIRVVGRYESIHAARRDMIDGQIEGYVVIPDGFTEEIKRGSDASALLAVNASNIVQVNPVLMSFSQATQTASAALFVRYAQKKGNSFRRAFSINQALQADISQAYNPDLEYSVFILPGLLLMILQQILLVALAFSITEERETGHEAEMEGRLGGRTLLIGRIVPHVLAQLLYGVLFTWVVLPFYGIHPRSEPVLVLAFLVASLSAVSLFGATVSHFFQTTTSALIALMFFSVPAFFVSGYSWPTVALPEWLRLASSFLPSTHFLSPYRLLVLGHISWTDMGRPFAGLGVVLVFYAVMLVFVRGVRRIVR